MPLRHLPSDPSLEHLRNEAKQLQRRHAAGDAEAVAAVRALRPRGAELAGLKRADVQLVVARSCGFPSWARELGLRSEQLLRLTSPFRPVPVVGEAREAKDAIGAAVGRIRAGRASTRWPRSATSPRRASSSPTTVRRRAGAAGRTAGSRSFTPPTRGSPPPFTALTGAFGYGVDAPNQPPHQHELELARLLLDQGADPNDPQVLYNNMWRRTHEHLDLLFAYGLGSGDGGPWFHRLAPLHPTPQQLLEEELRFATEAGGLERFELLVRYGVDVEGLGMNHPTLRGRRPLELALANGHRRIAEVLVGAGATATPLSPAEELLAACMAGDRRRVRELLDADEGLAAQAVADGPGRLIAAVELDRADAVRLLVEIGFDVNVKRRTTGLHLAAYSGNREMVELLLGLGADPGVEDDEFHATPSGWARDAHHGELADHLLGLE